MPWAVLLSLLRRDDDDDDDHDHADVTNIILMFIAFRPKRYYVLGA